MRKNPSFFPKHHPESATGDVLTSPVPIQIERSAEICKLEIISFKEFVYSASSLQIVYNAKIKKSFHCTVSGYNKKLSSILDVQMRKQIVIPF